MCVVKSKPSINPGNLAASDRIMKLNTTFYAFVKTCPDNAGFSTDMRRLCKDNEHKNSGTVIQNEKGEKRCGLPFCPHAKKIYKLALGEEEKK